MLNDSLIIVAVNNIEAAEAIDITGSDILALTLPAMAILEKQGIEFLTLDDFIKRDEAYSDTKLFEVAFKQWLIECDQLVETEVGINRLFSSEAFWLLIRLSGLRYIVKLVRKINVRYKYIEIFGSGEITQLPKPEVDWQSLTLFKFGTGLNSVLKMFYAGIPNVKYRKFEDKDKRSYKIDKNLSLLARLPEILFRRGKESLVDLLSVIFYKGINIWVVQGGYDVDVLKRKCLRIRFKYIKKLEELYAVDSDSLDLSCIRPRILGITNAFLHEWLPYYENWVQDWILAYFDNVVTTYPSVLEGIKSRVEKDRPIAMLYSIGSEDALEEAIAKIGIDKDIPIFFFKHSGADNLFVVPSVFDEYMEQGGHIKRTQFLSSEIEKYNYLKAPEARCVVTGALSRPIPFRQPTTKKILYSVGPPTHHNSYKDMGRTVSDKERYIFAKNLLGIVTKYNLPIDIKIHPAELYVGYELFSELLSPKSKIKARILPEGSIERIFKNYGLIVLDMISTRVLSGVLHLNIPIVLCIPENFPTNDETFKDLNKRIYIVRNARELEVILEKYATSGLSGLYSESFSNKYLGTLNVSMAISKVKSLVCYR